MSSGGIFILVLLVLFVVWLLLVRPQRRRQLNQQAMIDHLRVGDEVLTAGGFFATVTRIDEDEVTVELSPGAEARLSKRAIAIVLPDEDEAEPAEPEAEPAEPEAADSEPVGENRR
jgi:preprotein translocase subunit YajC